MKRGRKPTGKALTGAERQARHRDRKHAELAALPDDPVTVGIPTLDGLGADGRGAHALDEQISFSSLGPRAQLLVRLLETLR